MVAPGSVEEHQNPTSRWCQVSRPPEGGSCGFHLTRTKWDPYPWVCGVDPASPAHEAGLQVGDCVLEVNGEDVLGLRVGEIALRVRAKEDSVSLLLWNSGVDPNCDPESLCCGPMPSNLQRLSTCMNAILSVLECPICLDTISPPAHQCGNGHLICIKCRAQSERCPVCRMHFTRGRSLLADQVFNSLMDAFELREEPPETRSAKLKQRLFGKKKLQLPGKHHKMVDMKITYMSPRNKFITRLLGKSCSAENLSTNNENTRCLLLSAKSSEFTNLKAKSLSSNEIFLPHSPMLSRSCSGNHLDLFPSSQSYQGSTQSLSQRLYTDFGDIEPITQDDANLYYCPCCVDCKALLKRPIIVSHIKDHEGPWIQYFKPKLVLPLPLTFPLTSTVSIMHESRYLFLKFHRECQGLYLWLWLLGSKTKSNSLHLLLTLKGKDSECPELSFKSLVFSLCSDSWSDVITSRKGVFLSDSNIQAHFSDTLVSMEIRVVNKELAV